MVDRFTFLHAADARLDSPLVGLAARSADLAAQVDGASRLAFDRLVDLAVEERCRFVVMAGDTFDGDLRDCRIGLRFLARMARLREAGVKVYLVAGNHDAANRWFDKLAHTDNVLLFEHGRAHTFLDHDLRVAIHGQSFGLRGSEPRSKAARRPEAARAGSEWSSTPVRRTPRAPIVASAERRRGPGHPPRPSPSPRGRASPQRAGVVRTTPNGRPSTGVGGREPRSRPRVRPGVSVRDATAADREGASHRP